MRITLCVQVDSLLVFELRIIWLGVFKLRWITYLVGLSGIDGCLGVFEMRTRWPQLCHVQVVRFGLYDE